MGDPPRGDQVPHLDEDMNDDQAPLDPPLTDGAIRAALFQMGQAISTQAQASTTQAAAIMSQSKREVVPRANQQVVTMVCCLTDITQIDPATFYESKVEEDPQKFIDDIYNIHYDMGLSTYEKAEVGMIHSNLLLK